MSSISPILEALKAWDGSAEDAQSLRELVKGAGQLRPGKGDDAEPGDRALAKFSSLYSNPNKGVARIGSWLLENPDGVALVAPLLGDPTLGRWPYHHPYEISEADARSWLRVLAAVPVLVDEPTRQFVKVMLQVRRRETWTVAAQTAGKMAHRDAVLKKHLERLWVTCWPEGLGRKWPSKGGAGLSRAAAVHGRRYTHLPRHTFVWACAHLANRPTGDAAADAALKGLTAETVLQMQLPERDADRSVVLRGYEALLAGPDRATVVTHLGRRAAELGADVMSEEALRDIYDALTANSAEGLCRQEIRKALLRARWRPAYYDVLWSWMDTARWFADAGDQEAVAHILETAGPARTALELGLMLSEDTVNSANGESLSVDALTTRLGRLLVPDRLHVMPPLERAITLCESRALLAQPQFATLDWPTLVRLATRGFDGQSSGSLSKTGEVGGLVGAHPPMPGTVAEVGLASLGVMMSHQKVTSRTLMRGYHLSREAVLAIADIDDGFVATQVAVHSERLLREAALSGGGVHGGDRQVRFLWQLLEQNPPARTFEELDLVLRRELQGTPNHGDGDSTTPRDAPSQTEALRTVIRSVSDLDHLRGTPDLGLTIRHFATLIRRTEALVAPAADETQRQPDMGALADDLEQLISHPTENAPLSRDWWHEFEELVVGEVGHGGFVDWALWLEDADSEARERRRRLVDKALRQLQAAVDVVRAARPSVTVHHFEELEVAASAIRPALGALGWPEQTILRGLLQRLLDAGREALDEGRKSRAVVESTRVLLAREDEAALASLTQDTASLALLPVSTLKDVHGFLLKHMLFGSARALRANCADRVPLPSPLGWMMPLYGAVAGGTFLVLDVGEAWLDLVKNAAWTRYGATVGLTLLASFLLMAGSSGTVTSAGSRLGQLLRHAARVVPTYLVALVVAFTVAAIAMATLGRFSEPHAPLLLVIWSSLSLFLGVFVGLIVQGQGITKRTDPG